MGALIRMNIHLENISATHWLLAFAGLLLHLLMKLEKARKKEGFTFGRFIQENIVSTIASVIIIPVCMIACDDPAVASQIPITYLTSIFLGYQSRSFFKGIMDVAKKRVGSSEDQDA